MSGQVVREELRQVVDQARRERIREQGRAARSATLAYRNREAATRAREKAEKLERERVRTEAVALAALQSELPPAELAALITAPVPAPFVPCGHRGLRAPRLAGWEDVGNFPADLRCPDCRMILDGPL